MNLEEVKIGEWWTVSNVFSSFASGKVTRAEAQRHQMSRLHLKGESSSKFLVLEPRCETSKT